ncbi:MAG: amidohydrolase [Pseudobacter sp.]|uniref:amidohydrolase n=1 Tax=Pseudobacter sp. TaxID=2045420 RepID=UPI003F7E8F21
MSDLIISLIQSDLHWENKEANLSMFEEKIHGIKERTHIVLLPEMFSTGFSMKPEQLAETMHGPTVEWMKKISASRKVILAGSLIIEEEGNYHNRLVWVLPNGQTGFYDKRHLFAFADEHKHYAPGNKRLIAAVNGWKVNLMVCYDLRFPVWARQSPDTEDGAPEYDLLIYVANWPERRNHAWKTLLQARAIENQCFVAGVNRVGNDGNNIYHSGDSMVVDPMGAIIETKVHDEGVITVILKQDTLNEIRTKLPFLQDGDEFNLLT